MDTQDWVELSNSPLLATDYAALASSVSLTDITSAATTPPFTIQANDLFVGASIHISARGKFSTTGTPTLLLGVYYGGVAGVALATTGAITTTSGVTNVPWSLEADIDIRTIGTSGTALCIGTVAGITGTAGVSVVPLPASAPAAVTIDTTAAKALTIGAQWGTSSASNTITAQMFKVQAFNVGLG